MTNSHSAMGIRSLIIICVAVVVFPLLTTARSIAASTSVSVVNNSSRTIRNLYLSHVNTDDWGANQLNGATISSGQSFNLTVASWDQQQIKLIAEDQDGCFLSTVVSTGDSATWTINNDTARDCGY